MPDQPGEERATLNTQFENWVLAAFRQARTAGKPDWYLMLAGVLKNRILQLSGRAFREEDFNEQSFLEVLFQFPQLISVDLIHRPPIVELTPEFRRSLEVDAPARPLTQPVGRIRRDLWNAVLDYRRPETWVWDEESQLALAVLYPRISAVRMPTANDGLVREWREEFAAGQQRTFASVRDGELAEWITNGRATLLPPSLRREWSAFIKAKVLAQLAEWSRQNSIPLPELYEGTASTSRESEVLQLRALLTRAISSMTLEELHRIQIPASVILRIQT